MPRLRQPNQGRQAAAVIAPAETPEDDLELEAETPEGEITPPEDPTIALKAQIEALQKSEREAKAQAAQALQERQEAIQRAKDREAEASRLQKSAVDSQAEALAAALAGANSEAEAAQQEIEMAAQLGDMAAQAKAYRRLARAEAKIETLENGKAALERQVKEVPHVEERPSPTDALDKTNLPPLAKQWLRNHPEYLYDSRKNAKIQALHWDVVDEGHEQYSADYFDVLEQKLGLRQAPPVTRVEDEDVDDEPAPPPRRATVSAPPSREVPTSNGKRNSRITLSLAQKEAAKIAGISEEEYAKGLMKLSQEKANGNYGGAP